MSLEDDIEKIAIEEGFEDISQFVHFYLITKRKNYAWLCDHITECYNIYYAYITYYTALSKFLKKPTGQSIRVFRWTLLAREEYKYPSVRQMFNNFKKRNLTNKEISSILKVSEPEVHRLKKIFEIREVGKRTRSNFKRRKCKDGFKSKVIRDKWNRKSIELGFADFRECLKFYLKRGYTLGSIAKKFGTTRQTIINRRDMMQIKIIIPKLKRKKRSKRK